MQMGKCLVLSVALSAAGLAAHAVERVVASPDGRIVFKVDAEGKPSYSVAFDGREAIGRSALGFAFADEEPMSEGFEQCGEAVLQKGRVEAWKPVVRNRHADVRLEYNSLEVPMREKAGERRRMDLEVRAFDGGIAFRYTLYGARVPGERIVTEELTEFRVPATSFAWVGHNGGKSFMGSQETRFEKTPVREIKADDWCLAPFLVEIDRATYVALLDAHLDNYPGRCFAWRDGAIATRLVPSPREGEKGAKARFDRRFETPWRVVLVGDNPGRFMESEIVRALNPPCAIADTSWIRPGMSAWDHWWSGDVKMEMPVIKEYIDFAAKQGWPYMLVDWQWYGQFNTPESDITRPAPQIDMPELLAYAKERGVRLWLWLYSSDVTRNDAFEEAFALYSKWGVAGVKIDFMERHDREIVNWYRRITASAAKNRLMLDFHGAYAPDGIERTYPNLLTREGVLGEEFSKFSRSITPDHNVTLAFTRMLAGPMDYTPGGFLNVSKEDFKMQSPTLVMNTRAAELAKFVVYESPWTCFCEHPRNVVGKPGSEFVAEVPTVWDDTRFVGGYPGEWVAVARRSGSRWYLGVLNGNDAREVDVDVSFLDGDGTCRYWMDGEKPADVRRGEERVSGNAKSYRVRLAPGGGMAAVWEGDAKAAPSPAATASFADFDALARRGEDLSVVFFGGSLTFSANASDPNVTGIRGLMADYLRSRYPAAHFTFHDAAIGGSGSLLGAFRLERDVLSHKPDLVFLDFLCNDGTDDDLLDATCAYEYLLREMIGRGIPVEQMFFTFRFWAGRGFDPVARLPRRNAYRRLAEEYGTPDGDVHLSALARDLESGKRTLAEIWPIDGAHPADLGYRYFFEAVREGFERGVADGAVCRVPAKPVFGTLRDVRRLSLCDGGTPLPKGWTRSLAYRTSMWFDGLSSRWMGDVASAKGDADPIRVSADCNFFACFGEGDENGLRFKVTADGAPFAEFASSPGKGRLFIFRRQEFPEWWKGPARHEFEIAPIAAEKGELHIESVMTATIVPNDPDAAARAAAAKAERTARARAARTDALDHGRGIKK